MESWMLCPAAGYKIIRALGAGLDQPHVRPNWVAQRSELLPDNSFALTTTTRTSCDVASSIMSSSNLTTSPVGGTGLFDDNPDVDPPSCELLGPTALVCWPHGSLCVGF